MVDREKTKQILQKAKNFGAEAEKRILINGNAIVTLSAAEVFAEAGIHLLGVESQSVGPENAPMAVHLVLLKKEVVLTISFSLSYSVIFVISEITLLSSAILFFPQRFSIPFLPALLLFSTSFAHFSASRPLKIANFPSVAVKKLIFCCGGFEIL